MIKVAFITKNLTQMRGASLLMYTFANAISNYSNIHARVIDVEDMTSVNVESVEKLLERTNKVMYYETRLIPCVPSNLLPCIGMYLGSYKVVRPLEITMMVNVLFRNRVMHPREAFTLLTMLARYYDIIHMGLWKETFPAVAYVIKKKKLLKNTILVSHPLIHHDPFITRLKYFIRGFSNRIVTKLGYRSLLLMLREFDAITVSTPYEYSLLKSNGFDNVWFVGEGIDLDFIDKNREIIDKKRREIKAETGSENIVAFIGFRDKNKGYYDFLKMIMLLIRSDNNIAWRTKFLVLGKRPREMDESRDGIEASLIEKKLVKHGLLKIYETLPETDKYALIEASDIVVLPSYGETIPLVFLEAWAFKKPVVGYKIPTVSSIIRFNGDGGFLAKLGDVRELANTVDTLLADATLRKQVGCRGYEMVKSCYNLRAIAERLVKIYKHLLS